MLTALTYAAVLTSQYDAVRAVMRNVIAAQTTHIVPGAARGCSALHFAIQFLRWGLAMGVSFGTVVLTLVRSAVIIFALNTSGAWTTWVADNAFERVPNALVAVANNTSPRLSAPQQFDSVSLAIDNLIADVRRRNTTWSISAFGNAIAAWVVWFGLQLGLAVQAFVWMVSVRLMAIAICVGMWLAILELFDRTRGFVNNWIGVVVGLLTFQLAASIYLQIAMHSEMELLRAIQEQNNNSNSVDMMIANLGKAGNVMAGDAITMISLGAVFGGGGGIATHAGAKALTRHAPALMQGAQGKMRVAKQKLGLA